MPIQVILNRYRGDHFSDLNIICDACGKPATVAILNGEELCSGCLTDALKAIADAINNDVVIPEVVNEVPRAYKKLVEVLDAALLQASIGKGKERHASGEPFESQPICSISRRVGIGFTLGQAIKKVEESIRLSEIKGKDAAIFELLGAINYLAAAVIVLEEQK